MAIKLTHPQRKLLNELMRATYIDRSHQCASSRALVAAGYASWLMQGDVKTRKLTITEKGVNFIAGV